MIQKQIFTFKKSVQIFQALKKIKKNNIVIPKAHRQRGGRLSCY